VVDPPLRYAPAQRHHPCQNLLCVCHQTLWFLHTRLPIFTVISPIKNTAQDNCLTITINTAGGSTLKVTHSSTQGERKQHTCFNQVLCLLIRTLKLHLIPHAQLRFAYKTLTYIFLGTTNTWDVVFTLNTGGNACPVLLHPHT
jgi:hypothetical protein